MADVEETQNPAEDEPTGTSASNIQAEGEGDKGEETPTDAEGGAEKEVGETKEAAAEAGEVEGGAGEEEEGGAEAGEVEEGTTEAEEGGTEAGEGETEGGVEGEEAETEGGEAETEGGEAESEGGEAETEGGEDKGVEGENVPEEETEGEEEPEEELKLGPYITVIGDACLALDQEPWPEDVKLYQPKGEDQILLADNANCLAVQAYLKMCDLAFEVEPHQNAENMSPSGRVPFIKCGGFLVSELEPIVAFVGKKGVSLTSSLDSAQKADMRAYMSLVNSVLANAEQYVSWCDKKTLNEITKPRYGSTMPWPLNHIVSYQKRSQVTKRLGALGWSQRTINDVYSEVDSCCSALSERLEGKKFFFGDAPTDLDAVVYGHLFAILTTPLPIPENQLAKTVRDFPELIRFVKDIDSTFFGRTTSVSHDSIAKPEGEGEGEGEPAEDGEGGEKAEGEEDGEAAVAEGGEDEGEKDSEAADGEGGEDEGEKAEGEGEEEEQGAEKADGGEGGEDQVEDKGEVEGEDGEKDEGEDGEKAEEEEGGAEVEAPAENPEDATPADEEEKEAEK